MTKNLKSLFIIQWVLFSSLIFYLSSQSYFPIIPQDILNQDKIIHLLLYTAYGLSSMFFIFAIIKDKKNMIKVYFIAILLAVVFAASDEFHQSFVPNRTCDIFDFLTDVIGILFSIYFFKLILKKFKLN